MMMMIMMVPSDVCIKKFEGVHFRSDFISNSSAKITKQKYIELIHFLVYNNVETKIR